MFNRLRLGWLMLGLLLCCQLGAQEQFIAKTVTGKYTVDPPYVQKINQLNGVNLGFVRKVIRGHDGFMWMATDAGLVRYDGYDAKIFPVVSTAKDASKYYLMLDMVEDSSHVLWISTAYNGLLRFDPVTEQYQKFLQQESGNTPTGLIQLAYLVLKDKNNLLLCAGQKLIEFDVNTHQYQVLSIDDLDASTELLESFVVDSGKSCVATVGSGVYVYDFKTSEQRQFSHHE
ncbi:MAG: hypothetical protein MJK04_09310, partial [Psychrosphaera sp.]|nr:hypothetical protein [Psychrosphaera sp.]